VGRGRRGEGEAVAQSIGEGGPKEAGQRGQDQVLWNFIGHAILLLFATRVMGSTEEFKQEEVASSHLYLNR
jgi:hypothetical protein